MNRWNALRHRPALFAGLLILVAFLFMATGQGIAGPDGDRSPRSEVTRPDPDLLKGIHLVYERHFDDAEEVFKKVIAGHPDKPVGYFYLAMVSWSRLASGFWSPQSVDAYKNRIDRTIEVAQARVAKKVADSYDFLYLGGALGFKGRFELMKGDWFSSFFLARDAIDALKTCLKMDPDNKDVLLGIGTFDYYTARLSGVLKFLTSLLLHKGDKEEGLRKLNIAANEAIYSSTEAKSVLLHIYLFLEQDFHKARLIAGELARKYPENPRFQVLQGVSYIGLNMIPRYQETVRKLRQRSAETSKREAAAIWERRALYVEATWDLFQGRYPEARSLLGKILDHPDPLNDPGMIAWPLIKIGMSYDLEKNREEAVKYYNQVLDMENGSGAQFLAKKLLHSPLKTGDPFIGY